MTGLAGCGTWVARHPRAGRTWLAALTLLLACSRSEAPASDAPPVTIKLNIASYLTNAPVFIAQAEGFFADEGLRVEFVEAPQLSGFLPALAAGKLDAQAGTVNTALFNAIAQGEPLRIVAEKGHYDPDACSQVALFGARPLAERGALDTPEQLRGRKLSLYPMVADGYVSALTLEHAGLELDDFELTWVQPTVLLDAMQTGAVEVASSGEPWVTRLREAGHRPILAEHRPSTRIQTGVIIFGPSLLTEKPEAGRRFLTAYLRGVRRYNEGKTGRNLQILAEWTALDQELLGRACWPAIRDDGRIDLPSVIAFQRWALRAGWLRGVVAPEEFWDGDLIADAERALAARETRPVR